MQELPLVKYPPIILDAVAYAAAGDHELGAKTLEQLDPTLSLTMVIAMYGELARRYERCLNLEPGTVIPRLRAHYEAVADLQPMGPPPRKNRRVNR